MTIRIGFSFIQLLKSLAFYGTNCKVVKVWKYIFTCSDMNVSGLDPAKLIFSNASVGLGMDILLVVAGLEGRKDEISVVHHL